MTVGVSFGEARQAAFEWAGARERTLPGGGAGGAFPPQLRSPPVAPGAHANVVLSLTVPDGSTYTFGRDVNLLWKVGHRPPQKKTCRERYIGIRRGTTQGLPPF